MQLWRRRPPRQSCASSGSSVSATSPSALGRAALDRQRAMIHGGAVRASRIPGGEKIPRAEAVTRHAGPIAQLDRPSPEPATPEWEPFPSAVAGGYRWSRANGDLSICG